MNKFITTYKWVCLPFVFSSAAVLATPDISQEYQDAEQTSRVSQQFIGGNTQIGAGITDKGTIDINAQHAISRGAGHSTNVGLWGGYDIQSESKGVKGYGGEFNHNWVSTDEEGQPLRVNKTKIAYDKNAEGHDKVTLGYGQEVDTHFWEGRVSKGLSGNQNTRSGSGDDKISDRAYEYGVGASAGTFLPDSNLSIRAGIDHEWSTQVGAGEDDAHNTTLSAGAQKMFEGTGHSLSLDISGSKRSGGYQNGASSDADITGRLGYKYDFAGASSFQNASTTRRIRVEVPQNAVTHQPRSTQTKRVATFKTIPVYSKKIVKSPYKRMVKSTMGLEGQTFFKLNSSKLIPSAQARLTEVANQIKKTGYKGSIRITGNTCGLGNADYDQRLSERRAKSVRNFLIKQGFNPNHLMARGLGKSNPKYANIPGEGFKNRRVDIEYVAEVNKTQTAYRTVEKKVQTGTRKVATGFKNVPVGTDDVMIDSGRVGDPKVIWRTETIASPPAWIQRALGNNLKHNTSVNTFQTTKGFSDNVNKDTAKNDSVTTQGGQPVSIDVLSNDDAGTTITGITSQPQNGSAVIANGQIIYTPNPGFVGTDTFTYEVVDANGNTDTALVTVNVTNPVNTAPTAVNDQASTVTGQSVTIDSLVNDTDPENDTLTITDVTNPANGTATIVDGKIIYTPNPGFVGTDTFTYTISDGKGGTSQATGTVIVSGTQNVKPVAVDDNATTQMNTQVILATVSNDSDPDGDNLTITNVAQPQNGTATISADGKNIIYTPNNGFTGVDVFDYTISDGRGGTAMATETVTVTAAPNVKPNAVDDNATTQQNTSVTLATVSNDSDPDGDNLTIINFAQPQNGTATLSNDKKSIIYTPNNGFTGVDVFDYTISDGRGGTAMATETVTVTAAPNVKPNAVDDNATTQQNTSVTLATVSNDSDPDGDNLTIINVAQPQNGTATLSNDKKSIIYTPNNGFTGVDVFDYTISDGRGGTAMATETVTVTAAPNVKPNAVDDNATTQQNTSVTLATVSNDSDPDGDNLTIINVAQPQNGTATLSNDKKSIIYTPNNGFTGVDVFDYTISDGRGGTAMATETVTVTAAPNVKPNAVDDYASTPQNTSVTLATVSNDSDQDGDNLTIINVAQPQNGTATVSGDGKSIIYTPNNGFTGTDVFDYTISDGRGGTAMATETVTVTAAPNVKPNAADDYATTQQNSSVTIATVSNDSDPDGDNLTIINVAQPQNGSATISGDGKSIIYTPNNGFTGTDVFDYTISDGRGGTAMATETVTVTAAPNVKPNAVDDYATTEENKSVTISTVGNDNDPDGDDLRIIGVSKPQNGTATVSGDGKYITYTPNNGFTGVDVFDYTISDGNGGTSMATETITVTEAKNASPIVGHDHVETQENSSVTIHTLANDYDPDGDTVQIINISQPKSGKAILSSDGQSIIYTPNHGFTGIEIFDYIISDGKGGTAKGTQTIVVHSSK